MYWEKNEETDKRSGWCLTDADLTGKGLCSIRTSPITRLLERIPTGHIETKNSPESTLQISYICSIRILSSFEDIRHFSKTLKKTQHPVVVAPIDHWGVWGRRCRHGLLQLIDLGQPLLGIFVFHYFSIFSRFRRHFLNFLALMESWDST